MPRFSLFFKRIFPLLVLFLTPIIAVIAINSRSVAFPTQTIAQRITSPGLTTPTTPPAEPQLPIPVPLPRNPLPGDIKPSIPTNPTTNPTPIPDSPQFPTNHTNRLISPPERDKISAYLRSRNVSTNAIVNALTDTRFILHDTSVLMSPSTLNRERQIGRGPLGLGVNAFLPRENTTVLARPNFYEARRPTTSVIISRSPSLSQ